MINSRAVELLPAGIKLDLVVIVQIGEVLDEAEVEILEVRRFEPGQSTCKRNATYDANSRIRLWPWRGEVVNIVVELRRFISWRMKYNKQIL